MHQKGALHLLKGGDDTQEPVFGWGTSRRQRQVHQFQAQAFAAFHLEYVMRLLDSTAQVQHGFDTHGGIDLEPFVIGVVRAVNAFADLTDLPLGAARAQVHENYIIAQTETGIVIVDQHAAHERLVYEKLKHQMAENGVAAQALLIPEIVEMSEGEAAMLLEIAEDLARLGLGIEPFCGGAIAVRETPAILGEVNAEAMLRDILDELSDQGDSASVQARIDAILSRVSCHGSIRSGRRMQGAEMNALLREMEATPKSGQCNHGRPTYVELKLSDIERLFGRT